MCVRKPTIWVSNHVRHKPVCTVTEAGQKLEMLEFSTIREIKALTSFAVICVFVFHSADFWFSYAAVQKEEEVGRYMFREVFIYSTTVCANRTFSNIFFYSFNPSMYYSIAITVMEKFHVDIHPRKKEVRF